MGLHGRVSRWNVAAAVTIALLAIAAVVAVLVHLYHQRIMMRQVCHSQTMSILYWLAAYAADDPEGRYPDYPGKLLVHGYIREDHFICPSSDRSVALRVERRMDADGPAEARRIVEAFGPENTDFAFVTGLTVYGNGGWIYAFEKYANHDGERATIAIWDAVVWLTDAEFRERLKQTLEEARAAGYDPRIWGYAPGEGPFDSATSVEPLQIPEE